MQLHPKNPDLDHPREQHEHDHEHGNHDHPHGDHDHAPREQHNHEHGDHDHDHPHGDHDHDHGTGLRGILNRIFHTHGHSDQQHALARDTAISSNEEGIRTIWLALAALGATTILQMIIVWFSGSVALLADTVHNLGDTLNSIPLLIAFYLARRLATHRYTYGFGKAEDLAGIVIVASIVFSAGVIFWESFRKLFVPVPIENAGWVAVAAIIGFLGNEAVALLQIRTGNRIGSAAMVADGMHARTDGLTSLAVLLAVGGSWLGFPLVDPIIGIFIGITIVFIARDAVTTMWYRLMDAVDPEITERIERISASVVGVEGVHGVRARWIGHQLNTEVHVIVNEDLLTRESHAIAEAVRHALYHDQPYLSAIQVHVDPCGHSGVDHHEETRHHEKLMTT